MASDLEKLKERILIR